MNRTILVIAGLGLASGLAVAQEQEDQAFNPNRDIVSEPRDEPQTSTGKRQQEEPEFGGFGFADDEE